MAVVAEEVRVGEMGRSEDVVDGLSPRGVQVPVSEVGVVASCSLVGEGLRGRAILLGEKVGVVGRTAAEGEDGESGRRSWVAGESGRRNGEVRGDPNERGEGL